MAAVAAALLAVSCNKEQNTPDEPQQTVAGEQITITASIPAEVSKVGLAYTGTALHPTWAVGDKIRVADHSNSSNYQEFTLTAGEGTQSGTFTGTAVSASSYDITIVNATSWPANVLAQTQAEDESTAHLGYTVALTGVNTYEDIAFTSAWATSKGGTIARSGALHLSATLPAGVAAQVNNVTMVADKNIFGATGTMTIAITTPGDNGTANTLDVFASIPPTGVTIPSGTGILFKFGTTDADHSVYTRYYLTSSALNLAGGQLNLISLTGTNTDKYAGKDDDGTAAHPYLIADKYQLLAMNTLMEAGATTYFKLLDDIDLTDETWTPLNNGGSAAVNLNGNGKTISHLGAALFYTYNGAVSDLTIANADISVSNNNYGILGRQLTVAASSVTNVTIKNSSVVTTGNKAGGFFGTTSKACTMTGCVTDNVTVTGAGHYAGGFVSYASGEALTISKCHSSGTVSTTGTGRHVGGLVGMLENTAGASVSISDSYSACTINGYGFAGGLFGTLNNTATVERCYASGNVTARAINGAGGLGGQVQTAGVSMSNCAAWNGTVTPASADISKYSSGAVVGRTHPNCVLTDNYRSPDMVLTAYWVPSASYDHPNVNGTTSPLVRIGTDLDESKAAATDLTDFDSSNGRWAYHGKHVAGGTTLSTLASGTLGWSSAIWDFSGSLPTLK